MALPAVLKVTLKEAVPLTNAALAGEVALGSAKVMATVSLVLTRFQKLSTALTVTLKAVLAAWAAGDPLFPVTVAGAAVSPGTSSCN